MSTPTMMSNHYRRFSTSGLVGPARKRKERDGFDAPKPSIAKVAKPAPRPGSPSPAPKAPEPAPRNQLLAGYLAHEFLTKGTLFGQPWDLAQAEAVHLSSAPAEQRKLKSANPLHKAASSKAEPKEEGNQRYVELADLLKTGEAHIPGIVNPAQLALFLQL